MQIFSADCAMDALWKMVSPLKDEIPIYKITIDENEKDLPISYLLLRSDVTDSPAIFGDGIAHLRQSECDIMLISKTTGATTDDIHTVNIAKVKALLNSLGVSYSGHNLGYNDSLKESQYTWSVSVIYGNET